MIFRRKVAPVLMMLLLDYILKYLQCDITRSQQVSNKWDHWMLRLSANRQSHHLKKTVFHSFIHVVLSLCFMSETCASTHRVIHPGVVHKESQTWLNVCNRTTLLGGLNGVEHSDTYKWTFLVEYFLTFTVVLQSKRLPQSDYHHNILPLFTALVRCWCLLSCWR